jgi:hypothetical protein
MPEVCYLSRSGRGKSYGWSSKAQFKAKQRAKNCTDVT